VKRPIGKGLPGDAVRVLEPVLERRTRRSNFLPGAWSGDGYILLLSRDRVLAIALWGARLTAWERMHRGLSWQRVRPVVDVARRWVDDRTLDPWDQDSKRADSIRIPAPQLRLALEKRSTISPESQKLRAAHRWFETIPGPIRSLAASVPCRQWDLLQLLGLTGGAGEDLCRSNLPLAFMLATSWAFRAKPPTIREVHAAVSWKQRRIAHWLGFPDRESVVHLIRKLSGRELEVGLALQLRMLVESEAVRAAFAPLPRLTSFLLRMLHDPEDAALLSPALLREVIGSSSHVGRSWSLLPDAVHMLRTAHQYDVAAPPCIRSIRHAQALHEELGEVLRARDTTTEGVLPPPPRRGIEGVIEPIRTPAELVREGQEMRHCVGSYLDRVRAREYAVYRVLQPERATFALRCWNGRWELEQVRGFANARVSESVRNVLRQWLLSRNICWRAEDLPAR